ncbi:hypothetical protein [uncultured Polaribacter sp.]|uniref:hypothetical protein n=1 Tax=uncultured Polaribacter sp. TaxID=174711 RepID=UPI00260B4CB0|nr:hypothetical protein [uncultured Polaribacter sp.]
MKKIAQIIVSFSFFMIACSGGVSFHEEDPIADDPILNKGGVSEFTKVQPMTGIVV